MAHWFLFQLLLAVQCSRGLLPGPVGVRPAQRQLRAGLQAKNRQANLRRHLRRLGRPPALHPARPQAPRVSPGSHQRLRRQARPDRRPDGRRPVHAGRPRAQPSQRARPEDHGRARTPQSQHQKLPKGVCVPEVINSEISFQ